MRGQAGGVLARRAPQPTAIPAADDPIWDALAERMQELIREACTQHRISGEVCGRV